jgi:hypothetical protein
MAMKGLRIIQGTSRDVPNPSCPSSVWNATCEGDNTAGGEVSFGWGARTQCRGKKGRAVVMDGMAVQSGPWVDTLNPPWSPGVL